jgi:hypothetical protein
MFVPYIFNSDEYTASYAEDRRGKACRPSGKVSHTTIRSGITLSPHKVRPREYKNTHHILIGQTHNRNISTRSEKNPTTTE